MNSLIQYKMLKSRWLPFCILLVLMVFSLQTEAQEKPPRPISVTVSTLQQLNFGAIVPTSPSGGTVTVYSNGGRTSSGNIILLNNSIYSPALFLVDALPGTLIYIQNISPVFLTRNGGTLKLTLGEASTGSPFIMRGTSTEVIIGGTLEVKSLDANPAGFYSGTFEVTFIQQ